jgi:hypothetical protein
VTLASVPPSLRRALECGLGALHSPQWPPRPETRKEGEGAKVCGADVLVSQSLRCDMAD